MIVSQRPSASAPLRIARKISPSDQRFNGPAGVRLEGTNDPTGIGTLLPMSRPPVSSPSDQRFNGPAGVRLEGTNDPTGIGTLLPMSRPPVRWHALQKPSTSALPRISTYPEGSGVVAAIDRSACCSRFSYCETDHSRPPTTIKI